MTRAFVHVAESPMPGDVIEVWEDGDEEAAAGVMLRVIFVAEDYVWFKQYGKGRLTLHITGWRQRLCSAKFGKVIRPGDWDLPF